MSTVCDDDAALILDDAALILDDGALDTLLDGIEERTCFADLQEWVWMGNRREVSDAEILGGLGRALKLGEVTAEDIASATRAGRTPIPNGLFSAVYHSHDSLGEVAKALSQLSGGNITKEYVEMRMEIHAIWGIPGCCGGDEVLDAPSAPARFPRTRTK